MGEITRSPRYDLNQIPYGYALEVINRFKGLNLINNVPEDLCTEVHNIVQEAVKITITKKKKRKKAKWLPEEALQISKEIRDKQKIKRKVYLMKYKVPKSKKERQEGLLQ